MAKCRGLPEVECQQFQPVDTAQGWLPLNGSVMWRPRQAESGQPAWEMSINVVMLCALRW